MVGGCLAVYGLELIYSKIIGFQFNVGWILHCEINTERTTPQFLMSQIR